MNVFEFRILNPATNLPDLVLPDVETYTIAPTLSDVGTIQFTYPHNGVNYSQIQNDRDLYVFYKGAEVQSLRSTIEQNQGDDASLAEEGDLKQFNARMSFAHFDRAIVYPSGWPTSSNPATQAYNAVAIGQVLIDLIQKAQSRGGLSGITWSFTSTHDSNGNPWDNVTISFNAQTTYLTCFQTMVQYALCDLKMVGYRLDAYQYQAEGVDHTIVEPPVILRRGRDLSQAQDQNSTMGLANVALVAGDNNTYVEVDNAPSITSRGRREIGYSQSGVTDEGTLGAVGTALLQTVADEVRARTLQLQFGDPNSPFPLDNFDVGDWVYIDITDGTLKRQRVIQWSISGANDGTLAGTVALDNIFQEKINRLNGKLNALQNGVVIQGKSDPTPVQTIKFPPQVPTGLGVGSSIYQDNQGHTFAQASITWAPVTQDTNGDPETELAYYAVQYRLNPSGAWSAAREVQAGTTAAFESPFQPGVRYDFQVSAVDNQGNSSGWSPTVTALMSSDTIAPNAPSTPIVSSRLGQLSVVWDGLDSGGQPMPVDFDHANVYVSAAGAGFTPSPATLFGTMRTGQSLQIPGSLLTYNTQYWVKLIAVDQSGNIGPASASGTATLVQVVYTDVGTGQVGLSNVSFSDVGNLIDNGSFEDPTWQAIRNSQFGGSHFGLDNTTSSAGTWSVIHTGFSVGTEKVVLGNIGNVKVGQVFMGAADLKMDSSTTSTMFVALGIDFLDKTGAVIQHNDLVTNWVSPSTNDNTWRVRISGSAAAAPAGTVSANTVLTSTGHTAGHVWLDNIEIRMQLDTLLVADAAITDAKISSLSANKITAGTIAAGLVLTGTMETATSGGRVLVDGSSDTIYAYDNSGVLISSMGVDGLKLYTNPGGASVIIDHAPGSTKSPVIKLTANSSSPPPTPSQIYANYVGSPGAYTEGMVLKSAIQADGSYVRIVLQSGQGGVPSAGGDLLAYDPSTGFEDRMLSWGTSGLTASQPGLSSIVGGWLPISPASWAGTGSINFIDNIYAPTTSFSAGVASFVNTNAGWQVKGGVFNCGNGAATQIQMISVAYNSGTGQNTITVHAFTPAGAAFTGTVDIWGLVWG